MEYEDDGELAGKIKQSITKREHFTEETIWNLIIQMLEGMKYLNNNNPQIFRICKYIFNIKKEF